MTTRTDPPMTEPRADPYTDPPPPLAPVVVANVPPPIGVTGTEPAGSVMTGAGPVLGRGGRGRWLKQRTVMWWAAGLLVAMGWDRAAWLSVSTAGASDFAWLEAASAPGVTLERIAALASPSLAAAGQAVASVLYTIAYAFGRMPVWLIIGLVLVFRGWTGSDVARVRDGLRRGVFIVLTPGVAGIAAELLKLISRRARPETGDGLYRFIAPTGTPADPSFWSTSGLGLASSHAAVAVGAALAAGVIFPRARVYLLILAAACAASRVLVGAHYVSDVYVGATIGVLAFVGIYAWDRRNNGGIGLREAPGPAPALPAAS